MKESIRKEFSNKENCRRGKGYICMALLGWCTGIITCGPLLMHPTTNEHLSVIFIAGLILMVCCSFVIGVLDKDGKITHKKR